MTLLLVWAAAIAGMAIAVVQMITARRFDLRPLILGCLALVVVVGALGVALELISALHLLAAGTQTAMAQTRLARDVARAIQDIIAVAVGVGGISGLGGLGIFLHDLLGGPAVPELGDASPVDPADPAPAA